MKFIVTFKDPDGPHESIADAAHDNEALAEKMWAELYKFCDYGEYVTIEFDTEAGTATVVKPK